MDINNVGTTRYLLFINSLINNITRDLYFRAYINLFTRANKFKASLTYSLVP